jgi:hypothetical protein
MKKLGTRNYTLISEAVKCTGTFNPKKILCFFEESLYCHEFDEIEDFLSWVHANGKTFGSGNYEQVFSEYKKSKK